jgi:hypothetical protein
MTDFFPIDNADTDDREALGASLFSRPLFYTLPLVTMTHYQSDPITGTWKCKPLLQYGLHSDFELSIEKEGEDVTGSLSLEGHFINDTLVISFRIFDYYLTGRLQDGNLIGEDSKDDGTDTGNWSGIRAEMNQEEEEAVSSSVVFLYEYRKVGSEDIFYSVEPDLANSLITHTAHPICRVWLNPSSVFALDYKAKAVQPGK